MYFEEFEKLNSKPMENRKVVTVEPKKKLNESDSRLSDKRFYFPSKLHDIIESLILQNGKEAASDLLSDLMDDFGLSYTPSNSREKYVDRVIKNIKNLKDTDKKTFDKLYGKIPFDDLL